MKSRVGIVFATVLGGLLSVVLVAPASAADAPPAGSGAFVAEPGVIMLVSRLSPDGKAAPTATPPQSFCYVGVDQPTLLPDRRLTETWRLDCRSLANPALPAPDISQVYMEVRIYRGAPSPWDPGQMVAGTACYRYSTTPSCSTTTAAPVTAASYYTRLNVSVNLTGGTVQVGVFVTDPIRFT